MKKIIVFKGIGDVTLVMLTMQLSARSSRSAEGINFVNDRIFFFVPPLIRNAESLSLTSACRAVACSSPATFEIATLRSKSVSSIVELVAGLVLISASLASQPPNICRR